MAAAASYSSDDKPPSYGDRPDHWYPLPQGAPVGYLPKRLPRRHTTAESMERYNRAISCKPLALVESYRKRFGDFEGHVRECKWTSLNAAVEALHPCNVLEIGFNAGHSASAILGALLGAWGKRRKVWKYTALDINHHAYTEVCWGYLQESLGEFADQTSHIWKPSTEGLADLIKEGATFDMIHVDGGHSYELARGDLEASIALMPDGGWLLMDDTSQRDVLRATRDWVWAHRHRLRGPYPQLHLNDGIMETRAHEWFCVLPLDVADYKEATGTSS